MGRAHFQKNLVLSVGSESLCHGSECVWDLLGILDGQPVMPGKVRDGTLLGCKFPFCHFEVKLFETYILEKRRGRGESLVGEKHEFI